MKKIRWSLIAIVLLQFYGCAYTSQVRFPGTNDLFVTTGDGDITKPYTPVGQILYMESGFRIPLPLLGMLPLKSVDPDLIIRTKVARQAREMGGNAIINLRIDWEPPKEGFLGIGANGGRIIVYGTVINM